MAGVMLSSVAQAEQKTAPRPPLLYISSSTLTGKYSDDDGRDNRRRVLRCGIS